MKTWKCIDCGKEQVLKHKKPPKRCIDCTRIYNRENSKKYFCSVCGKKVHLNTTKMCRICFIKSRSSVFRPPSYDDAFGNWLAGFTDGEGCFACPKTHHGQSFRINLREDDKSILEEIRDKLGCGYLYYIHKSKPNTKIRNQWQFMINSLADCVNVVMPLFDKYSLRAKKKMAYEIWKVKLLKKWKAYQK